jgi:hypothetical protein
MKAKAVFFLSILLLSLSTSWAMQMKTVSAHGCCTKKECSKPVSNKECNKDYCTPFQSCSNTPIAVAQQIKSGQLFSTFIKKYSEITFYNTTDFYSKHWQPPKVSGLKSI